MSELELGVAVTRFSTSGEAETIAAMLRSCGIEASAEVRLRGSRTFAVFVMRDDLEAARAILDAPVSEGAD